MHVSRHLDPAFRALDPGFRNLDPHIQDPGCRTQNAASRILDPGAWLQYPELWMQDPESGIQDPGLHKPEHFSNLKAVPMIENVKQPLARLTAMKIETLSGRRSQTQRPNLAEALAQAVFSGRKLKKK